MPPVTFSMTLSPIVPSLQAAATNMTGPEFCSLTEQVRDHLLSGNTGELKSLLAGRKIEASREVLGQIALGRTAFFDEAISLKILTSIAAMPNAQEAQAELEIFLNIANLRSQKQDQRKDAVKFFSLHPDPRAVELLIRALNDGEPEVRSFAAFALGKIGDARAVEPLIQALKDGDRYVRAAATGSLGEIGDARAVEPLLQVLSDENSRGRWVAVEALGRIGDIRAVEPLLRKLKSGNSMFRRRAAEALGRIGDARAVEPLIQALKDGDRRVRETAVFALGKIGDPRAIASLTQLPNDNSIRVFLMAEKALKQIRERQEKQST